MDILFAENSKKDVVELKSETVKDLALNEIIGSIAKNEGENYILRDIFTHIPTDTEDIRYRSEIMKDFLDNEKMTDEISEALNLVKTLKEYGRSMTLSMESDNSLYVLLEQLRELSVYVNVSEDIVNCLKKHDINSRGLKNVLDRMEKIVHDEKFEEAKKDINTLLEDLSVVRGAIVGVNFTADLNVETVSSVEFVPYKIRSKYTIAEIAATVHNAISSPAASNTNGLPPSSGGSYGGTVHVVDPLLVSMTPLMEKHMKRQYKKMKMVMNQYIKLDSTSVTEMFEGLTFYVAMAKFAARIKKAGFEICMPDIRDTEGISMTVKDLYNVRLFLANEKNIVKNDFSFSPKENIFVLTGPNRGGKTIIEQALGIISVMASIGSFVTASSFEGRPFNNILTHFPIDENLTINYGRLGEEAVRIKEIVAESDDKTLILFNETYSTTSAVDGLYLSKDLIRVLKEIGTAVIFNTHIHELVSSLDEINSWEGESSVVSLVMEIKDNVNTFRVKRSIPESKSYARNIAEKYGITYEQMKH